MENEVYKMEADIYDMELHQEGCVRIHKESIYIVRVAGGWIYRFFSEETFIQSSVFIPFNNEFQKDIKP